MNTWYLAEVFVTQVPLFKVSASIKIVTNNINFAYPIGREKAAMKARAFPGNPD